MSQPERFEITRGPAMQAAPPQVPPPAEVPRESTANDDAIGQTLEYIDSALKTILPERSPGGELVRLADQVRSGQVSPAAGRGKSLEAVKKAGEPGLGEDGTAESSQATRFQRSAVDDVPRFDFLELARAALIRRHQPERNFKNEEWEFCSSLGDRDDARAGVNLAHAQAGNRGEINIPVPMGLFQASLARNQARQFAQTYGTGTIDGSTGSAQIAASREETYRRDLLVDFLRPSPLAASLGIRTIPTMGDLTIPRMPTGSSVAWATETGAAADTGFTVSVRRTSPKRLAGFTYVSWQLQISEGANGLGSLMLAESQLNEAMTLACDRALFQGGGTNEPTGVLSATGVQAGSLSATPTYAEVVALSTLLSTAELDPGMARWLATYKWLELFKTTLVASAANAQFLLSNMMTQQGMAQGVLDGKRLFATNNLPTNLGSGNNQSPVILGIWPQLLDLQYAIGYLTIDDVTHARNGVTAITLQTFRDALLLRENAFVTASAAV